MGISYSCPKAGEMSLECSWDSSRDQFGWQPEVHSTASVGTWHSERKGKFASAKERAPQLSQRCRNPAVPSVQHSEPNPASLWGPSESSSRISETNKLWGIIRWGRMHPRKGSGWAELHSFHSCLVYPAHSFLLLQVWRMQNSSWSQCPPTPCLSYLFDFLPANIYCLGDEMSTLHLQVSLKKHWVHLENLFYVTILLRMVSSLSYIWQWRRVTKTCSVGIHVYIGEETGIQRIETLLYILISLIQREASSH